MQVPQAYFNGQWMPANQVALPIYDSGFVLGTTVTEQLRTFGGRLFRLDEHLARLARSLEIIELNPGIELRELGRIAHDLAAQNHALVDPADDLALGLFITPGPYSTLAYTPAPPEPCVCIYTYRLPFGLWAHKFQQGESIVISTIEQISPRTWSPELKCRSRMHYFLADREAASIDPGARAVLLDEHGQLSEATTANVLMYRADEGLVSPPREKILPGISMHTVVELADELKIPFSHRDIDPVELASADEILLTSTSICVLPAVRLDRQPVGTGQPGKIFQTLLSTWSQRVGLDIAGQARRFASRPAGMH